MRQATIDDFRGANVRGIFSLQGWALISAERYDPLLPPALNRRVGDARTEHLKAGLKSSPALSVYECTGRYEGRLEASVLVLGIEEQAAAAIGRFYGQDTIIVPAGLLDVNRMTSLPHLSVSYEHADSLSVCRPILLDGTRVHYTQTNFSVVFGHATAVPHREAA